jgi:DNA-binding protein HU-beta
MNKETLVADVVRKTKLAKSDVARVVDTVIDTIRSQVARGQKVTLSDFGTFQKQSRAARTARDLATNQPIRLPRTSVPSFRPGRAFREAVAPRRSTKKRAVKRATRGRGR